MLIESKRTSVLCHILNFIFPKKSQKMDFKIQPRQYRVIDGESSKVVEGMTPVTSWAPDGALPYPFSDEDDE